MDNNTNITFNFAINLNCGVIQDQLIKMIDERLTTAQYKNQLKTPGLIIYSREKDQIVIDANQGNFKFVIKNPKQIIEDSLIIIGDILALLVNNNLEYNATYHFIILFSNKNINVSDMLKKFSTFDYNDESMTNVKSTGYRFISDNGNAKNEFKVEPLLSDMNQLFMEGIYNHSDFKLESLQEKCSIDYADFKAKSNFALQSIDKISEWYILNKEDLLRKIRDHNNQTGYLQATDEERDKIVKDFVSAFSVLDDLNPNILEDVLRKMRKGVWIEWNTRV